LTEQVWHDKQQSRRATVRKSRTRAFFTVQRKKLLSCPLLELFVVFRRFAVTMFGNTLLERAALSVSIPQMAAGASFHGDGIPAYLALASPCAFTEVQVSSHDRTTEGAMPWHGIPPILHGLGHPYLIARFHVLPNSSLKTDFDLLFLATVTSPRSAESTKSDSPTTDPSLP
jgi:hypothetical protein